MNIYFKNEVIVTEEPYEDKENIRIIKSGEKIEYLRTIKIDNDIFIILKNGGYILVKENDIQEKGAYIIETYLEQNKVLDMEGSSSLKINNMNEQYFEFEPINNTDYLIYFNNGILGIGRTKEGNYSVKKYEMDGNIDDSFKWNLIKKNENLFQISNKFFGYFLNVPQGNTDIGTKILLSSEKDLLSQYFYLWKKDVPFELHISLPFMTITKRMIERKGIIKYLEIDNYIENFEYNFSECQFLEKVNCCYRHLKYFKDLNLKEIIIREELEEIHIKKEAFKTFTNLISITLPKNLASIEKDSFINMKDLKKVNAEMKWYKYFNIDEITIKNGTKKLKREIFYQWKSLKKVYLPNSIEDIEKGCFEESGIEEIEIPKNIKTIPENAFKNCFNLRKVKIPQTIIDIDATAFSNCPKLKNENIDCPYQFKNLFQKSLKIYKNILTRKDCEKFPGIEEIEIPLNTKFTSEEDEIFFFSSLPNIIKVNMDPKYFKRIDKTKLISIRIPNGLNNLNSHIFEECFSLEYLEIPQSVIKIHNIDAFDIYFNLNMFDDCINLKIVKMPEQLIAISQYLFHKCYNLKKILNFNGEVQRFKLIHQIKEGETILNLKNLCKIKNLNTLIIPSSIKDIEINEYELSECLECVECDPKWLQYLPIYQLKKIIIPEFVEFVNETDFNSAENVETLVFKGNTILYGNKCIDFENIPYFICYPSIAIQCSEELKKSQKTIMIYNQCEIIDKQNFKNWTGLKCIYLPKSLKIIREEAFANCLNLFRIEIPDSVYEIHENSFENCKNLCEVECNGKFLNCFPRKNVKLLKIKNNTNKIDEKILNEYINLEALELPPHIDNLNINLPKLFKLKCSGKQLENLPPKVKRNIQSIELYPSFITKKMLKNCNNIQNFFIPENIAFENPEINETYITTIADIINSDSNNKKYEFYIRKMVNDINSGIISGYDNNDILGEITYRLTEICLEIKIKCEKKINPHPVQCFAMIRLLNEILHSKGTLAEIQTGEGKSYIISVVAIALVKYKKRVDIVTPTLELAFRDEQDQREYYKLFNIKSGVLASAHGDKEFIELYNTDFKGKKYEQRSGFYTHVLDYEIIYSTNYNYQFLHLFSLFQNNQIRKRKYDVVIVDEVDNMLLDQMIKPAIIGNRAKFYNLEGILKDIFLSRDMNEEMVLNKLKKYSKISNINLDIVKKCKKSARIANFNEFNVDYIIENNKAIIIDKCTGYKQPETRWSKYIHEFCEIKENLKIEFPILSYCSINQNIYFNLYNKIAGVTGTIGNLNDQSILKNNYNINIFKVPRNKIRPKKIVQKTRPNDEDTLFNQIYEEIIFEVSKGRPILVIMDSLKHVETFKLYLNENCNIISGVNFDEDKKTIQVAGKEGQITLATAAGGRGVDIKLTKKSIEAGGLHVIIPFLLPNERCEIQAFGRSGRQGQPGSATIYRDYSNDFYIKTPEFDPKDKNKYEIQEQFDNYINENWPWLYKSDPNLVNDIKFEFNSSVERVFDEFEPKMRVSLVSYAYKDKKDFIDDVYSGIIMSWSFFFNYLEWNIKTVNINEEYRKYIKKLNKWIPKMDSLDKCFKYFTKKFHMEEIINNILYPKPKILKNVEMNDLEFLKEQARFITKGLFNVEINYLDINYEYIILAYPKITGKISQSQSIQVENQSESFPIKNNVTIGPKSLNPKFSQEFFGVFGVDYSSAIISIKMKLNNLVKNGVVSVGFGYKKIQFSISISRTEDLVKFAGSILFTIYLDFFQRKPFPALVPLPYPAFSRSPAQFRRPAPQRKSPFPGLETFPLPEPKNKVNMPQQGPNLPDIGKWFNDNKETLKAVGGFIAIAGICIAAYATGFGEAATLAGFLGRLVTALA